MSLVETGFAALKEVIDNDRDYDDAGAFRGVVFFVYNGQDFVIKHDTFVHQNIDDRRLGLCYAEAVLWNEYKDTEHKNLLCPVLHYGEQNGVGFSIMPRLKLVHEMSAGMDPSTYFKDVVVNNFRKRYPKLTTHHHRIYLPNNLFGNDLHWGNLGYDTHSGDWQIIDYAGEDTSDTWEWQEENKLLEEE
jgi:hypothetical protein